MPVLLKALALPVAAFALVSASEPQMAVRCNPPQSPPVGVNVAPNSTWQSAGWPPQRFQRNNAVRVTFTSGVAVTNICAGGVPPCGYVVLACQRASGLILPNPCTYSHSDEYARLVCHELAHLNGWPATHGD